MRRLFTLSTVVLVLTHAFMWSDLPDPFGDPLHIHAQRAGAQATIIGPGGIINSTYASAGVQNSTGELQVYKYTLLPSWVATSSQLSVTGTVTSSNVVGVSAPLHVHCNGRINAAAGVGVYFGANFGGGTATVGLVNGAQTGNASTNAPVTYDVWLAPIATGSTGSTASTGQAGATSYLVFRVAFGNNQPNASETAYMGSVIGTTALASPQEINIQARFAAAAASSIMTVYNCTMSQGF